MNRREVGEIKSLFSIEDCGILKVCGCYVDGEKNKVTSFNQRFLSLPEEEQHKYFEIFRKTLSGKLDKNLFDVGFNNPKDNPERELLLKIRKSDFEDENLLNEFYQKVIESYDYVGNYLILLINQYYDIPGMTSDNTELEDGDEVYNYILCSICPVNLSKPGLGYVENESIFHNEQQHHMVDAPDTGFLFPSFNNRQADDNNVLIYAKKKLHEQLIEHVLNCRMPSAADSQKEMFQALVSNVLDEDCDFNTVKSIHENLNDYIDETQDAHVKLIDETVKNIFEESGVTSDKLNDFEDNYNEILGSDKTLTACNVTNVNNLEIRTDHVTIKVDNDKTDLIEEKEVNGQKYLMVKIDGKMEVNGVEIKI